MAHRPRVGHVVLTRYTNKPERLDYFLSEMEHIREDYSSVPAAEEEEEEETECNEQEEDATWLKKAGFENVVYLIENTRGEEEILNSSEIVTQTAGLPKAHAAIIRQRMHTLRTTIRSKQGADRRRGSSNHGDVRQLFQDTKQHVAANNGSVELLSVQPRTSNSLEPIPVGEAVSCKKSQNSEASTDSPQAAITVSHPPLLTEHSSVSSSSSGPSNGPLSNTCCQPVKPNSLPLSKSSPSSPESTTPTQTDMKLSFCLASYSQISKSESLPSISLDPDTLGTTTIDDLSAGDMEKIQCLAHIELTITFEENCIPRRTLRTPKLRHFEEKQFGVPLSTLLMIDQQRHSKADMPLLFKEMVEYLEKTGLHEEGILRVSGSRQRIKDMQDEIEATFTSGSFCFEGRKTADVASLLKQFLRELPLPLLTFEHLPAFASIADITDLKEQVRTLNLLILMLPSLHQTVLKRLLQFCERIHKSTERNKMDLTNVSMVLAPNLFHRLPAGKLGCDDVTLAAKTSHVVLLLIRYHNVLWTVPSGMLAQVRFLYESELKKLNMKNVRNALQKMNHSETPAKRTENSNNVIKVRTPFFTSFSKVVNIQENPTAGTVITKLSKRSQLNLDVIRRFSTTSIGDVIHSDDSLDDPGEDLDMSEQFLYEVGGNIGERRLDPNTNMLALYEVNPCAEWVIKPRNCPCF